jgi:hypothetical protein
VLIRRAGFQALVCGSPRPRLHYLEQIIFSAVHCEAPFYIPLSFLLPVNRIERDIFPLFVGLCAAS